MAEVPAVGWPCSSCTFVNTDLRRRTCAACRTRRAAPPPTKPRTKRKAEAPANTCGGYAARLSDYKHKGVTGLPETEDAPAVLEAKLAQLIDMVRAAERVVVLTGAGVSTSVGLPDFRGPKGIWTLEDEAKKKKRKGAAAGPGVDLGRLLRDRAADVHARRARRAEPGRVPGLPRDAERRRAAPPVGLPAEQAGRAARPVSRRSARRRHGGVPRTSIWAACRSSRRGTRAARAAASAGHGARPGRRPAARGVGPRGARVGAGTPAWPWARRCASSRRRTTRWPTVRDRQPAGDAARRGRRARRPRARRRRRARPARRSAWR